MIVSIALLLAAALFLGISLRRPSSNFAVLAGIALGLASVWAHAALAIAPILLVPLFALGYPSRIRRSLAGSGLFGLAIVLAVRGVDVLTRK